MTKAFKDKKTVFHGVKNSDGKKPNLEDPKYADAPYVDPDDGKTLEDVKKKFAPNADKPTSASAEKKDKKLPEIMQKIDPQKKAQIIPEMYKQMQQLRNVLNAGSAAGGGGSGGGSGENSQGNTGEGNAAANPFLEDALTAAFVNLSKKFTFEYVIMVILLCLDNGGINKIDSVYKEVVINAVINFIKLAIYYGPTNIPVSTYPLVPAATVATTPETVVHYEEVPVLYVRQWYTLETNPYPAFIEWESPDGSTTIYTKNTSTYYFDSANEEIFYKTEVDLTNDLIPYFANKNLTAAVLNDILDKYAIIIEHYNLDSSLGKGAGEGLSQDKSNLNNQDQGGGGGGGGGGAGAGGIGQMMGMLQGMLGGKLKEHMQNILEKQLPQSVNDQKKVKKNIQRTTQDMANNKKGFDAITKMFGSGSGGMMGGMNIQGMLSGLMSGGGAGGGAGGGSSGGGGGGAGSGVPSGQGNYSGGGVSTSGLDQIKALLKTLGMQ